ncbi:MAG: caspase family protein [Myxococcota bacterium]
MWIGWLTLAAGFAADWRGLDAATRKELASEARVALVVGNAAYERGALKNPVRDAKAIAERLASLGFDVELATNVSRDELVTLIRAFGKRLSAGGTGMFYFAGHGVQVDGVNYMIPVDAEIDEEAHVESESVAVERVLGRMEGAGNRLNLLVLDACRNNPYERGFRSTGRGLSGMDAPRGTMIAFATAPDTLASDGSQGGHGLYTGALLKVLGTPGLDLEDTFKAVRAEVSRRTDGAQLPQEYTSVTGDFFFAIPADETDPAPGPSPEGPTAGQIRQNQDYVGGSRASVRTDWDDDAPIFGVGTVLPFLTLSVDAPRVPWFGRVGIGVFVAPGISLSTGPQHGFALDEAATYNGSLIAGLRLSDRVVLGPAAALTIGVVATHPLLRSEESFDPGFGGSFALDLRATNVVYVDLGATFSYDGVVWLWPTAGISLRYGRRSP